MHVILRLNGSHDGVDPSQLERIVLASAEPIACRIKQIVVYIEDVDGPCNEVYKQCRYVVHRRRSPPIVIQDYDNNIPTLVERAANRATEALKSSHDCAITRAPSSSEPLRP